jgi:hypothetical protein
MPGHLLGISIGRQSYRSRRRAAQPELNASKVAGITNKMRQSWLKKLVQEFKFHVTNSSFAFLPFVPLD